MSWPREYGGAERPGIYDFVLTEALSRYGAPQPGKGVGIVGKTLIRHGNEKLKQYFLPRIIRGEVEFAIGYSEPNAGSDAASMQLRAEKVPGGGSSDRRSDHVAPSLTGTVARGRIGALKHADTPS
jgi:alkylation response protein AidB-like acyl-CoA dehydrogenase